MKPSSPRPMLHPLSPLTDHTSSKQELIEKLLDNTILLSELTTLREMVTAADLSVIIQRIFDLNETYIFKLAAVEGMLKRLNRLKNGTRNQRFDEKIKKGFRDLSVSAAPGKKQIVLAEGDSWFNYPIILSDVIDRIGMEPDLAVYSIASGGDWLLNMLSGREYVEQLSVIHPDWFLISGGGNDLVGSRRLATILQPSGGGDCYALNEWAQQLVDNANTQFVPYDVDKFHDGLQYVSKDFYALLMFFHLQYYFLFSGVLRSAKFPQMNIITQGYDYPLPSFSPSFGWDPTKWYVPFIRLFLGHGNWLKKPMQIRGIVGRQQQQNVLYTMIYLFNEMMIELGRLFNRPGALRIFHIDSRGSVGENGWTDELHPRPKQFLATGKRFVDCIRGAAPDYAHVFVVKH
jgi:hypothetical protein